METRFAAIDPRLDRMDSRLDGMADDLAVTAAGVARIERKVETQRDDLHDTNLAAAALRRELRRLEVRIEKLEGSNRAG
jgi:hypothetical protein